MQSGAASDTAITRCQLKVFQSTSRISSENLKAAVIAEDKGAVGNVRADSVMTDAGRR